MDTLDDPDEWDPVGRESFDDDGGGADPVRAEPFHGLTAKQRQVLDLLIQHKTSKEISRLLGISPHTVDQRIMLARAKLNVGTRGEVAQAYRSLLEEERKSPVSGTYERSIYGFSDMARAASTAHQSLREDVIPTSRPGPFVNGGQAIAGRGGEAFGQPYHHVLPEVFDGPNGTLLRLGAIALIAVFLILVVMGGLAMFSQLSQMVDR